MSLKQFIKSVYKAGVMAKKSNAQALFLTIG
ncbi:hypothetical protein swp_0269 [Shewanella piezotolerans WP3]|uniref:Uncharacterized protein n=1 Tax=Shewanella piezotolerans (strain WP3 / JCM 13877) TaxID=225849 RepID=B8CHI3_SHEPW|nr:hypothetical protein swp_0269 [Shewanella piezotolerans WP3]